MAGRAWLTLHPQDAAALGLEDGDGAVVGAGALEVRLDGSQAPGSAGFSVGYPETLGLRSGQWTAISRA